MINSKKVLAFASGLFFAVSANNSLAQVGTKDPAILFKISDITPVVSSDGITNVCDFTVTLFNRSTEDINGASIDLIWSDNAAKNILANEKNNSRKKKVDARGSYTEDVTANFEIANLPSMKQLTVKSRLQSDRCFILMEDVKIRVKSCNISSQSRAGARSATVCANLFRFVSPNSEEYYREFNSSSIEEDKVAATSEKERVKKEMNDEYSKAVAEFERASQIIREIK